MLRIIIDIAPLLRNHLPFHPYARAVAWDLVSVKLPICYVLINVCLKYIILPFLRYLNHTGLLASLLCRYGLPKSHCANQEALQHVIYDIINADLMKKVLSTTAMSLIVIVNMVVVWTVLRIETIARRTQRQRRAQARLRQAQGWQRRPHIPRARA